MTRTFSGVPGDSRCECSDPGCAIAIDHGGKQCTHLAATILYRVDMEDVTGTALCESCADDAMESGLFAEYDQNEVEP